ncbi:MerR family transcriptional regulator [Altererythrobacter arenosus]|uniref:MerR family transcriptional regulator n=1 Tax=Altererythrobacter arenosus TaxID=3032592 RepID=A0ABY8G095_9SPHN|nr:MerR family transcriptional regulator [Altererythrobacter sp. CAU 1644]WFL79066.1 MerR family transcriptional regulator [Altererythrobacter sp. CAU 1644]
MSSGIGIGQLATKLGVKPSAIRYYESEGLLPRPARRSGRRIYDMEDLLRLETIIAGRKLGFSISKLRELADLDQDGRKELAHEQALFLRTSIAELSVLADKLEALSGCDCSTQAKCLVADI